MADDGPRVDLDAGATPSATGPVAKVLLEQARQTAAQADEDARSRERAAREREIRARRRETAARWSILAGIVVVLVIAIGAAAFAVDTASSTSAAVAEFTTTGQVASARAASAAAVRGTSDMACTPEVYTLVCANRALRDAGLRDVPDPGPAASAYQVSAAVGGAYGTLNTLREIEARGVDLPGVTIPPGPDGGPFPDDTLRPPR